jgi:hypothetical protein
MVSVQLGQIMLESAPIVMITVLQRCFKISSYGKSSSTISWPFSLFSLTFAVFQNMTREGSTVYPSLRTPTPNACILRTNTFVAKLKSISPL